MNMWNELKNTLTRKRDKKTGRAIGKWDWMSKIWYSAQVAEIVDTLTEMERMERMYKEDG